jgi:hypothetical protein
MFRKSQSQKVKVLHRFTSRWKCVNKFDYWILLETSDGILLGCLTVECTGDVLFAEPCSYLIQINSITRRDVSAMTPSFWLRASLIAGQDAWLSISLSWRKQLLFYKYWNWGEWHCRTTFIMYLYIHVHFISCHFISLLNDVHSIPFHFIQF